MLADKLKQRISVVLPPLFGKGLTLNREEAITDYRTLVQFRGNHVHHCSGCVGFAVCQGSDYLLTSACRSTRGSWVKVEHVVSVPQLSTHDEHIDSQDANIACKRFDLLIDLSVIFDTPLILDGQIFFSSSHEPFGR